MQKTESCRGMLSSHTNSREQHAAACFPYAAAWRLLTKLVFLTHAATCQIMPRHDLKNLKIKTHKPSLFYSLLNLILPNFKPLFLPISNPLNLTYFPSQLTSIPLNTIFKPPIHQHLLQYCVGWKDCLESGRVAKIWRNHQLQFSSKFLQLCW